MIRFLTIICGAQTYRDLELFGNAKKDWLSPYLPNGIPNADTFERIFELLDPMVIAQKMRWILQIDEITGKIIAFDGKIMGGTRSQDNRGFHVSLASGCYFFRR